MYKINKSTNNVEKLEKRLFKELKIKERDHLQEWIAKNPEMLGEDLLIIQKEYDGFNDTNERLDLLAINKNGGLVIIENKLDDTGRDVVWQALKYTSYCSTLTTSQIIKIYQDYLNKWQNSEDAKQNLLDFLEISEEELLLNRNDQRMIFVANNYRKEVTSTVLWLLKHDIQIKCFRATPYSMGDDVFLQVEQIIPLPETAEFMIDAKEKEKEESAKSKTVEESELRLTKFWTLLKAKLKENKIDFLERVGPNPYYNIGFSKGKGYYGYCLGRHNFRVELYLSNDTNKELFDAMYKYKDAIESKFEGKIEWERLDNKKASRIKFEMTKEQVSSLEGKFSEELYWNDLIDWYADAMVRFYNTVNPYLEKIR
ncbi:DUF4268 domain-containing protein [Flavobacterium sp.]|uniref:DUF4268 domain-containing protein n=1 Tax=Flavobacterium sp. TaxID=239 RepID=UPI003752CFE6